MKYLKTYEKFSEYIEYEVGDYVRTYYHMNRNNNKLFKILLKTYIENPNRIAYSAIDVYGVKHHLKMKDIKRKMNKKEIEQFELLSSEIKYNL